MIELLVTAQIIWTLNKTETPCQFEVGYPHACYVVDTNTIYISKEIKGIAKDFALYHEIGHSLYKENFPKEIFQASPYFGDPDYEVLANDFGWWMYGKKHPKERKFVDRILSKEKQDYFSQTCNKKCIKNILKIKIK